MGLEDMTGTDKFIDDFVNTNPVGATDPKSQGDDHLRGIKNVLLNTFPNITGAVTPTQTELNLIDGQTVSLATITALVGGGTKLDAFADGTVMPFFQATAPTGWTKSATNNDKALRVVSGTGGGTGGTDPLSTPPSTAHTHTGPSHTHTGPSHLHTGGSHALSIAELAAHTHTATVKYGGGSSGGNTVIDTVSALDNTANNTTTVTNSSTGSGSAHSHGNTSSSGTADTGASGTDATGSTAPTAFAPEYVDVILCAKDA